MFMRLSNGMHCRVGELPLGSVNGRPWVAAAPIGAPLDGGNGFQVEVRPVGWWWGCAVRPGCGVSRASRSRAEARARRALRARRVLKDARDPHPDGVFQDIRARHVLLVSASH